MQRRTIGSQPFKRPKWSKEKGEAQMQLGKYRHYKGKFYEVIGMATHSETMEELVVYKALYGEYGLWVRPKQMFSEEVLVAGRSIPRFQYIGDGEKS